MINIELISGLSILLPVIFGLYIYKYLSSELRLLLLLCCIGVLFEGFNHYIKPSLPSNVKYLSNYVWYGLEFVILMQIFKTWSNNKLYFRMGLFFLVILVFINAINGFSKFDPTTRIISSIIIAFSVNFLFRKSLIQEDRAMSVVFAGLFFYFSFNILVFLMVNIFSIEMIRNIWNIHTAVNILMNISFFVGFYMRKAFVKRSINSGNISSGCLPDSTTFN